MPTTLHSLGTFIRTAIAAVLVLGSASTARSAERVTPPLFVPTGGGALCTAVNVSRSARMITIEVRDDAGDLIPSASCSVSNPTSATVGAGEVSATILCSGSGLRYCRVAVKGPRNAIRGILRAQDSSFQTFAVVAAE